MFINIFIEFDKLSSMYAEKTMTSHSSTLAWEIPWTKELGGIRSMGPRKSQT